MYFLLMARLNGNAHVCNNIPLVLYCFRGLAVFREKIFIDLISFLAMSYKRIDNAFPITLDAPCQREYPQTWKVIFMGKISWPWHNLKFVYICEG